MKQLERILAAAAVIGAFSTAGAQGAGSEKPVAPMLSISKPTPDPRVGLRGGYRNAAEAIWNLKLVSTTQPSERFLSPNGPGDQRFWQSDMGFTGKYVAQGNFSGFQVWDISNPAKPTLANWYVCPGSQVDVSFYKNLLFLSHESMSGRVDCGIQGVPDSISKDRARGIRVYDISNMSKPIPLTIVQTCRGSHTHTVVEDPNDSKNVYVYVSGSAGVRSPLELAGCSDRYPSEDPNSSLFRIEVIQVPLDKPGSARVVSSARIFDNLGAAPSNATRGVTDSVDRAARRAAMSDSARRASDSTRRVDSLARIASGQAARDALRPPGPTQCHDITVYPWARLAGGACGGYGLLLDLTDPKNPRRIGAAADSNFAFWHSATFNNDATKVLFTDEWGGGTSPRCRSSDKYEWGANALFDIDAQKQMHFAGYYKMPAVQTSIENCVAHNGSLIPVPGRDIMVQGWYQGGISIFDFTDTKHPMEIAYHDRGPIDTVLSVAGSWSAYWYNGHIFSSEIGRGLDIFDLLPSAVLTQNEIDAANTVRYPYLNVQGQPHVTWPASFAKARAFVDQLERTKGLSAARLTAVRNDLTSAERANGAARATALKTLASGLNGDLSGSADRGKLRMLIGAVNELAK